MRPAIPITDPRFKYTPSGETDIRVRFAAVRLALKQQQPSNVTTLKAKPKC